MIYTRQKRLITILLRLFAIPSFDIATNWLTLSFLGEFIDGHKIWTTLFKSFVLALFY